MRKGWKKLKNNDGNKPPNWMKTSAIHTKTTPARIKTCQAQPELQLDTLVKHIIEKHSMNTFIKI